jgi:hypothetical protein
MYTKQKKGENDMNTEIHHLAQHMIEEQLKRQEADEVGASLESLKSPITLRIEDRNIYILDQISEEYHLSRSKLAQTLLECAISDLLDQLGYSFDQYTADFIEYKKKQKQEIK